MINSDILLQIFYACIIRGIAHQWFVSYLKNKTVGRHWVAWCNNWWNPTKTAEGKIILYGVLQGFLIGLLFLVYFIGLGTNIGSDIGFKLTLCWWH
jgi:uncharacterized membrane protein